MTNLTEPPRLPDYCERERDEIVESIRIGHYTYSQFLESLRYALIRAAEKDCDSAQETVNEKTAILIALKRDLGL
jgi:hypothetical protein